MTNQICSTADCCETADFYDVMEHKLMQMTFWAHKEVLFEKLKERIEKTEGAKLDKIAELLVSVSQDQWKDQQEARKKREELRDRIQDAFESE